MFTGEGGREERRKGGGMEETLELLYLVSIYMYMYMVINPRRACAARVTVVVMSVCPLHLWSVFSS